MVETLDAAGRAALARDLPGWTMVAWRDAITRTFRFDDFAQAVRGLYPDLRIDQRVEPAGGFAGFAHVRHAASDLAPAGRELDWRPAYSLADALAHFAPYCVSAA